jgi:hypothetical protein
MSLRIRFATALLFAVAVTAIDQHATAQSQSQYIMSRMAHSAPAQTPQNAGVEELPAGQLPAGPMPAAQMEGGQGYYMPGDGAYSYGGYPDGCADGYCGECCDPACAAPECGSGVGSSSGNWCGFGGGQFYFVADYLNVRASFSEATAKVEEDLQAGTDDFIPLDWDFESSYRFGGGYRLCCCGEEIRFLFTRMTSSAEDTAQFGDIVPIEASPPPGGTTFIDADVDAKSYDLEWAKTIPLGGQCCDPCGSPCGDGCQSGCGDACCGRCCPAWDITWSGGVRWGDVEWGRRFDAQDDTGFTVTDARSELEFRGAGLRTGLEGRRYFFKDGWLSLFAKGNISLLYGTVDVTTQRDVFDPTNPGPPTASNRQTFTNQQIIPVTELEAGITAQATCHTAFSAGYLMAAWHDLGIRDEDQLNTLLPVSYDDANILGFDGFFARVEWAY